MTGLTRAQLLQAGAAALLVRRTKRRRVIVVGAGLAGLSAGFELRSRGFDVVVLEARDRVGGRVWTVRAPFTEGQHAEAGGEYVDTQHHALLGYVRRFGLQLEDVRNGPDLDDAAYYGGRRYTGDQYFTQAVLDDADRFWSRLDNLDPSPPLDRLTVASQMDGLSPRARERVTIDIRDDFDVEPDRLSLLFAILDYYPGQSDAGVEAYRIRGGNDQVPKALAAGLHVVLREPVTAISQSAAGVVVTAGGTRYRGDYCVVAAPLPALRRVSFSPAPPPSIAGAIRDLQYGTGAKTMLQYRRRVWRDQGFTGDTVSDLPFNTAWEATDRQAGTPGILLVYTVGAHGAEAARLSAAERNRIAAAEIDRVYPGSRKQLGAAFSHAWSADPWAGGTYAAFAPGQWTAFAAALRRPFGRVWLAGEHTAPVTGYMDSAIRSGQRAAAEIAAR